MISAYNVGNFNAVKVSVGPGRNLKSRSSQDAANIVILSLQRVNSIYLVFSLKHKMSMQIRTTPLRLSL